MFKRADRMDLAVAGYWNYVDTRIYYEGTWLAREIQWRKLEKLYSLIEPGESCLDYGCGSGVALSNLAAKFKKVIGIDRYITAAKALNELQETWNVFLFQQNGYKLTFEDEYFDAVFCASTLEHFKSVELATWEIFRVLKPGGRLYFLSPSENWIYDIGRRLLGYTKPEDHYHKASDIQRVLKNYLKPVKEINYPIGIPIYKIGVYEK